jgi:hypothetical protein
MLAGPEAAVNADFERAALDIDRGVLDIGRL